MINLHVSFDRILLCEDAKFNYIESKIFTLVKKGIITVHISYLFKFSITVMDLKMKISFLIDKGFFFEYEDNPQNNRSGSPVVVKQTIDGHGRFRKD